MAKVKLQEWSRRLRGYCWYAYPSLWIELEEPGLEGRMSRYFVEQFAIDLNERHEIISVGGYLPHQTWHKAHEITLPHARDACTFEICEEFGHASRPGSVPLSMNVTCDFRASVVHIRLGGACASQLAHVRPHDALILGATRTEPSILTDIYCLNVKMT